jgi:acetyltransferase-like isoleucine patch superfamily enzyme
MYRISILFLKLFCKILSRICPYSLTTHLQNLKLKLHTFWISKEFKRISENASISYPIELRGGKYITIGDHTILGKRGVLTAWDSYKENRFYPEIKIGDNTSIGDDYHITAINRIDIGNNVLMGKKITITDNSHGTTSVSSLQKPPSDRQPYSRGSVVIEDGVWLGDKVTILPNVTIGMNSIIGANALVTKNIPANCMAGGVPAMVIKKIF